MVSQQIRAPTFIGSNKQRISILQEEKQMNKTENIILAGNLLLIEEAEDGVIFEALRSVGKRIGEYCGHSIDTSIRHNRNKFSVRYNLDGQNFIEFATAGRNGKTSAYDGKYCTLELENLSHLDRDSLPVRVMFDVFNWS